MIRKLASSALFVLSFGAVAQAASDPVAQSFERMLAHQASSHLPLGPSGTGVDPLIGALIEPLRDGQAGRRVVGHSEVSDPASRGSLIATRAGLRDRTGN